MENHPSAMPGTDQSERESAAVFDAVSLPALLRAPLPEQLQRLLGAHIRTRRWFRGKARTIRHIEILDQLPLSAPPDSVLMLIRVSYRDENPEVYVLPLACAGAAELPPADSGLFELIDTAHATTRRIVYDPSGHADLPHALLDLFVRDQTSGDRGRIRATPTPAFTARVQSAQPRLEGRQSTGEQSNTTVLFGQEFMLKLFRQLEAGENPDVELNEFLWAHGYRHVPEPLGSIRYEGPALVATLGIAQRFVPGDGTAWDATLEILHRSLDRARSMEPPPAPGLWGDTLLDDRGEQPAWQRSELVRPYVAFATLLGERTAELHLALAADADAPAFKPEPFTIEYQHSLVQAARERVDRSCDLLAKQLAGLSDEVKPLAEEVFAGRGRLCASLDACDSIAVHASRIRCHGDYHLGQVLYGSGDFTILDFEGEPAQPLELRRQKGSALYDVCGMLRSFHYAGTVACQSDRWPVEDRTSLRNLSEAWYHQVSALFLSAYLMRAHAAGASPVFLPESRDVLRRLLRLHLIDKCSYELSYELNNRPAWVGVPIAGLIGLANAH